VDDRFASALGTLNESAGRESELWRPFLQVAPVTGVALSTIAAYLGSETVAASGPIAARIDEVQFDLGEGPCWDAMNTSAPVFDPDVRADPQHNWPSFYEAISSDGVGAVFAFPLAFGPLKIGAVDLYSVEAHQLSAKESQQTAVLAKAASRIILNRALRIMDEPAGTDDTSRFSRRIIHQATGMVLAQLTISADDAALLIRGHAFATGRSMAEVANDIVERQLSFAAGPEGIGNSDE
jgi:hypothetical protein